MQPQGSYPPEYPPYRNEECAVAVVDMFITHYVQCIKSIYKILTYTKIYYTSHI